MQEPEKDEGFTKAVTVATPKRRARPCVACDGFACPSCEWTGIEREKQP